MTLDAFLVSEAGRSVPVYEKIPAERAGSLWLAALDDLRREAERHRAATRETMGVSVEG